MPKIPEGENGAIIVLKGAKGLEPLPDRMKAEDFNAANKEDAAVLKTYISQNDDALGMIEKGLAMERFAYTTDFHLGVKASIPPLTPFRNAARVFVQRGELALAEGRHGEAFVEFLMPLRLCQTMSHDEFLITHMISIACGATGLRAVLRSLQDDPPAPEALEVLLKGLVERHAGRGTVKEALDAELHCFMFIELARAALGEVDFSSDYRKDFEIFKRWRDLYTQVDPIPFNEAPEWVRTGKVEEALGMTKESGADFSHVALPALGRVFLGVAENETMWRGAMTLTAVRLFQARNGKKPAGLADLDDILPAALRVDPFSGKPLVYEPKEKGFLLYSTGPDGKDDGGKAPARLDQRRDLEEDHADYVFHRP
jgi:hypothetical protein